MLAAILAACIPAMNAQSLPVPTPAQLRFHDWEVGMFIHFAPNTWFDEEYDDLRLKPSEINPSKLDTDQWVRVAESMGAKYIVFVAKHVGGFCWWQTDSTPYSVKNAAWRGGKGDVMKDLSASCKKRGMNLGVYLSPADRHFGVDVGGKSSDPAKQAAYEKLFRQQLTELLSRYGEMQEVWFDGSLVFDVGDILKKHAPNAVVFQGPQASIRWVGNEDGYAPDPAWNAVKFGKKKWGDYTSDDGDPDGDLWLPNECDARMRNTWFWRTDNLNTLKSVDKLMDMYEKSVGRGSVLLLNNTPDPTGLIPEPDAKRSAEFGAEVKRRYGHAIIDTAGSGDVVEMMLSAPQVIDAVIIQEDIANGERVRSYVVEAKVVARTSSSDTKRSAELRSAPRPGEVSLHRPRGAGFLQRPGEVTANAIWIELARGTAIGHKKIDKFEPVEATAIRLRILKSTGKPVFRRFAAHRTRP